MGKSKKLITGRRYELVEDHHTFGSGRYSIRIMLPADISAVFPFLNAVLSETVYDHENCILVGTYNRRRYAFRPHEIHAGIVTDSSEAPPIVEEAVSLVNRVWEEHELINPSFKERSLPSVYDVYRLLPGTNCKECGYTTCLACAADIRNGVVTLDKCGLLLKPEYADRMEKLRALLR